MSFKLALAMLTMTTAAQAQTFDGAADDPFAMEKPLAADELKEQRGGMVVNGEVMMAGRFALHFGQAIAEFSVNRALEAADGGSFAPDDASLVFDPGTSQIVINNDADNVVIGRTIEIDVTIPDFHSTLVSAHALRDLSGTRIETRTIETLF
ncbi:MAG: hypothetical protein AAGJ87_01275 [Pseudomonadota bacterium]